MSREKILFCGNGRSCEIVRSLKDTYDVFMISDFEYDIGIEYVDKLVVGESKYPEEALKAAIGLQKQGFHFDAVLSLCMDSGMSVSRIAEYFGLISIPFEVARRASIKSLRSKVFEDHGIPAPKYRFCERYEDLVKKVEEVGLPVVLKPVDLSSSKGVVLVGEMSKLEESYSHCTSLSKSKGVVINEYVQGIEYSTEGLMIGSRYHLTGISERVFNYGKYKPLFVETGDIMPTLLSDDEIKRFADITEGAALALGITDGVTKGDLIYTDEKEVKVFEIAPRLGGPRFGTEMIPLSNGTNILRAAIQQALGEDIDLEYLKPKFNRGMVNRSIFPKPGRINNVSGIDEVRNLPGYYDFKWCKARPLAIGDTVSIPISTLDGAGYIIASGANREEAIDNADRIEKSIIIETE